MPAGVLTFRVKKDSEFYKKYFEAHEERKFFLSLAREFFDKYDIDGSYYHCHDLEVQFTDDAVREKYKDQLCSRPDKKGFYRFKKASPMNKEWRETVTSKVNFDKLNQCELWFLEEEIYGLLEPKYQDDIIPADYMIPIKRSEYYAAVEKAEDLAKFIKGGEPNE